MKGYVRRTTFALFMATTFAMGVPGLASAKDTPTLTPVEQYQLALRTYDHAKFVINRTFHKAIESDRDTEIAALQDAQSPAESLIARADFNVARATDITTWVNALKKLGGPPKPPAGYVPTSTTTTPPSSVEGVSGSFD